MWIHGPANKISHALCDAGRFVSANKEAVRRHETIALLSCTDRAIVVSQADATFTHTAHTTALTMLLDHHGAVTLPTDTWAA